MGIIEYPAILKICFKFAPKLTELQVQRANILNYAIIHAC